ncbi:SMP-30/gluconolactonase/LRE family protein [Saccharibacillus sp. CPCC 101409]|uniref:SMP-30/gluconolactonase/LRE family protein n=1 Tax=Saccharibacillus sp. CPCC 101409 TaxID=3058041 RepID=UPI0026715ACB|nr:SMP-30/gluconolactonase/LRE family protein [Saccharibacillus sp. CPCC 101409]MDO3410747.1 SMP-30/gluconolactonase/LRE family protein [Saccharibacillus sp. CPCC 101409]
MNELKSIKPEPVSEHRALLGEGPNWLESKKALMWVDIEGRQLRFFHPEDSREEVHELPERAGAAVGHTDDKVVLAVESGFAFYDLNSRKLEPIQDPENRDDNRFNDGKCDASGRFWAGTMSLVGKDKQGGFYCLDGDLSVRHIFGEVSTSNGLGWSPDGTVLYYIDTGTKKVQAFEFDADKGELGAERTVVSFENEEGWPDGMAVDADGDLWIAHYGGARVSKWEPVSGRKIGEIALPVDNVTCCAFGGEDLGDLYITTAQDGLSDERKAQQPLAGALFVCRPGPKGQPAHLFGQTAAE